MNIELKNQAEKNFFLNCKDCLYYGYGFEYVVDTGVDTEERRKEIYKAAKMELCEEF